MLFRADCEDVPLLSYGHYPLGVMTDPGASPLNPASRGLSGGKDLVQLLLRHNVTMHVAGHLHAAFGRKLHRMHQHRGQNLNKAKILLIQQIAAIAVMSCNG